MIVGGLFGFWMRKRKFDRSNPSGIEQFPSYLRKLVAKFNDFLLGFFSVGLIGIGIVLLANYYESSWGWLVLVPLYLVALFGLIGT